MLTRRRVLLSLVAGCGLLGCDGEAEPQTSAVTLTTGGPALVLRVPAAWQRLEPAPASYRAQWRVPGDGDGMRAIAGVRALGSAEPRAALDEWRRQFQQDPPENEQVSTLRFPGRHPMLVLQAKGSWSGRSGQSLIAVVLEIPQAPHLIDLVGDAETVAAWHEAFHSMLASARLGR